MPPRRHLSVPEVARLVTLVLEGYRYRQVGEQLGVSASVVSRAVDFIFVIEISFLIIHDTYA